MMEHDLYKKAALGILPDPEATRKRIIQEAKEEKTLTRKFSWVIPAIACTCAAIVICTAVPSVRAAITQWFKENFSVQNYVAQPAEQRQDTPELEAIISQTMPEQADSQAENSIELVNVAPEWQELADNLKPSIGDIYYDGRELIVGFDMGGGVAEFLNGWYWDQDHTASVMFGDKHTFLMNSNEYQYAIRTEPMWDIYEQYAQYIEGGSLDGDGYLSQAGWDAMKNATTMPFTATIDFSEQPLQLDGIQTVEVELPLLASDRKNDILTEDGHLQSSGEVTEAGKVKIVFSFDPQAGKDNIQTYEINQSKNFVGEKKYCWLDRESEPGFVTLVNKTVDLSGVNMTISRMDVFKSDGELYVELTMPDDWGELDKENFLNNMIPIVLADGNKVSSDMTWLDQDGVDAVIRIKIDMLPSEIQATKNFEVVPILTYFTEYDNAEYVEGEPMKLLSEEMTGYDVEDVTLENCTIEFDINQ